MPERFIKPILIIIAIAMLAWILFWLVFMASQKKKGIKISFQAEVTFFLFYVYVIAVMSLTIFPLPFDRLKVPNDNGINITPVVKTVKGLMEILSTPESLSTEHIFQNIAGNIVMFIPLGIFLPLLSARYRSGIRVFILSAVCSISIEFTQLILRQFEINRTVDIDDVILNTLGALLGFLIIKKLYFTRI
ncbi:MAG: VanZ family protein [Ginsengibacter sp.]